MGERTNEGSVVRFVAPIRVIVAGILCDVTGAEEMHQTFGFFIAEGAKRIDRSRSFGGKVVKSGESIK